MTLNNIYKINEKGEAVRLGCYYYEAIATTKNELFQKVDQECDRYAELNLDAFPVIKQNQKNKYLRENKSFFIKSTFQAWDNSQAVNNWDSKMDLYLSNEDIIQEATTETPHENRKGCTEYEKKILFTLKKPLFFAKGLELKLYKDFAQVPEHLKTKAKSLETNYNENRDFWTNKGKINTIKAYQQRMAEGWKLYTITNSQPLPSFSFWAGFGYVRNEKTNEYKHAEKITDILNSCVYDSNRLSIYEVLRVLEKVNITIKRK